MFQSHFQKGLIFEYYQNRPNQDIPTAEVVDWATTLYFRMTGKPLRDPVTARSDLFMKNIDSKKSIHRSTDMIQMPRRSTM